MEVKIQPVEGQLKPTVGFDWEPIAFTESYMQVQLNFDQPIEISIQIDPNQI